MSGGPPLRLDEREIISRGLSLNLSARAIAKELVGRHHSTVSRDIKENGGPKEYRAVDAQQRAEELRARPKERKLGENQALHDAVNEGLAKKWSPRQISQRLRLDHPDDEDMRVSHETIYQCLYLQARGELRTQLELALRTGRTRRVDRSRVSATRGKIKNMINI